MKLYLLKRIDIPKTGEMYRCGVRAINEERAKELAAIKFELDIAQLIVVRTQCMSPIYNGVWEDMVIPLYMSITSE